MSATHVSHDPLVVTPNPRVTVAQCSCGKSSARFPAATGLGGGRCSLGGGGGGGEARRSGTVAGVLHRTGAGSGGVGAGAVARERGVDSFTLQRRGGGSGAQGLVTQVGQVVGVHEGEHLPPRGTRFVGGSWRCTTPADRLASSHINAS